MFSYEEFYKLLNAKYEGKFLEQKEQLKQLSAKYIYTGKEQTKGFRDKVKVFYAFHVALYRKILDMEARFSRDYIKSASLKELSEYYQVLYGDLSSEGFSKSYLNEAYVAKAVSRDLAASLSRASKLLRDGAEDGFTHRRYFLFARMEFLFALEKILFQGGRVEASAIDRLCDSFESDYGEWLYSLRFNKSYNISDRYRTELLFESDPPSPEVIYEYGLPVSDQDYAMAKCMHKLSQETIDKIASALVESFLSGLSEDRRYTRKYNVALTFAMGMERLAAAVSRELSERSDMQAFVSEISTQSFSPAYVALPKYNPTPYILQKTMSENQGLIEGFAGRIRMGTYDLSTGEGDSRQLILSGIPSYTAGEAGIMLPLPCQEDGDVTLEALIDISMSAGIRSKRPQLAIQDAIDQGDTLYIKGANQNQTDLTLGLVSLSDKRKQTNCRIYQQDGIIPGGEVRCLLTEAGSDGTLEANHLLWHGHEYSGVILTIADGQIVSLSMPGIAEDSPEYPYFTALKQAFDEAGAVRVTGFGLGTNVDVYRYLLEHPAIARHLPRQLRAKATPYLVFESTSLFQDTMPSWDPYSHKEIVKEISEEGQRRAKAPFYLHVPLSYGDIGQMSVLEEGDLSGDIIRKGQFVLIGTDILNSVLRDYSS